jgi:hypothetical protein
MKDLVSLSVLSDTIYFYRQVNLLSEKMNKRDSEFSQPSLCFTSIISISLSVMDLLSRRSINMINEKDWSQNMEVFGCSIR